MTALGSTSFLLSLVLAGVPSAPMPEDHPVRLKDELFAPFHQKDGVWIRAARVGDLTVLRSTTTLPASPERAARFFGDVGGWARWVKRLRASEPLSGSPPAFWLRVDAPWPFSDRDYALLPSLDATPEGDPVVWWESGADRLPPPGPRTIRISVIRGGAVFRPGPTPATTRIVYTDVAVLGGKVPAWAVRESYRRGPVGILGALRRRLAVQEQNPAE